MRKATAVPMAVKKLGADHLRPSTPDAIAESALDLSEAQSGSGALLGAGRTLLSIWMQIRFMVAGEGR